MQPRGRPRKRAKTPPPELIHMKEEAPISSDEEGQQAPAPETGGHPDPATGGYPGYTAGGYLGYSAWGYPGYTAGGYPGYAAGGYPGPAAGAYPGHAAGGYPSSSTGGYPCPAAGGYPGPVSGGIPDPTALTGMMYEMMMMMRDQRQHQWHTPPPPPPTVAESIRSSLTEFRRHGPAPFEGGTDVTAAELWIDEMEATFEVMQSPEGDRVRLASYMLKGRARSWYKSEIQNKGAEAFKTWKEFKSAFYSKYFSESRQAQMTQQFLDLKQGTMTVDEYEVEFDRLSRFASSLVADDLSKARRFVQGLRSNLRRAVTPSLRLPFHQIVDIAKDLEVAWLETQESTRREQCRGRGKSSRKSESSGGSSGRSRSERRSQPYDRSQTFSSSGSRGRGSSGSGSCPPHCGRCGGSHVREQCWYTADMCFRCGSTEHFRADCPIDQTGPPGGDETETAPGRPPLPFGGSRHTSTPGRGQRGGSSGGKGKGKLTDIPSPSSRPVAQGRVYNLTQEDAQASHDVVAGDDEE